MRLGRVLIYLAFIIIFALVGLLIVWQRFLKPAQQAVSSPTPTPVPAKIVVITQNIPQGYELDETVLATIPWQKDAIAPGMVLEENMNEVIGRQVKFNLEAGTPLLLTMLLKEGEQVPTGGSPWSLTIPPGMVAVSIPIDTISSVSYGIRPGDKVDVIVTLLLVDLDTDYQTVLPDLTGVVIANGPPNPQTGEITDIRKTLSITPNIRGRVEIDPVLGEAIWVLPAEAQRPRMVSQMLLQNVVVLQVGTFALPSQEVVPTPQAQGQQGATPAPAPAKPNVLTLIVRPQEAIVLNYLLFAIPGARLSLALRPMNDDSRFNLSAVTLQYLLDTYQIPLPARLPYGLQPKIDTLVPVKVPAEVTPQP